MSGKVIFSTGSFLGEMGTTADGELFINSHGKNKGVTLEGVKQYSQSAAGDLIEKDLDATTGRVLRERVKLKDKGVEFLYSGSSTDSAVANRIEFQQDNNNAIIICSGSNPGISLLESDTQAYGIYRSKYVQYVTASKIVTAGIQGTTHDFCISPSLVIGSAGDSGFRYSQDGTHKVQMTGSTGIKGNLEVIGSITATQAITSSIVSSSTIYSSGSNIFGDAITDTHQFFGHITASGNISSSGTATFGGTLDLKAIDPRLRLYATAGDHPGFELFDATTRKWVIYNDPDDSHNLNIKDDGDDRVSITQTGRVGIGTTGPSKPLEVVGDISASGNVYVEDDLYIGDAGGGAGDWIIHRDDADTKIGFAGANQFAIYAGDGTYYRFFASDSGITIGAGDDYDFIVQSNNDAKNIFSEGSTDKVGIGTGAPQEKLTVEGSISQSGALYGQVGSGVVVSSSVSDTTLFSVKHPKSGSVFEVNASGVGSGSLALSGSLLLNDNSLTPAESASRLYNKDGYLHWGGTSTGSNNTNKATIIAPHIHTEFSTYYNNGSSAQYTPWGVDFEGTSISSGYDRGSFPYSGRVLSVSFMSSGTTMNSTDISFHKNENTTAIESTTIDIAEPDTLYTAYFSGSSFDAGDLLHIKVDPTGTHYIVNVCYVIQLDITQDWPTQV